MQGRPFDDDPRVLSVILGIGKAVKAYLHGKVGQEVLIDLRLELLYLPVAFLAGDCVGLVRQVLLPFALALLQELLYLVAESSTCAEIIVIDSAELRKLNAELDLIFFRLDLLVELMVLEIDMGKAFIFILLRINEAEAKGKVIQGMVMESVLQLK